MITDKMAKARAARGKGRRFKPEIVITITENRKQKLRQVSDYAPKVIGVFRKAYEGKSGAAAIKAKCLDCCCLDRIQVRECEIDDCPLWEYRPYRQKTGDVA